MFKEATIISDDFEVRAYLEGKNISQKNLRQIIYQLAAWFHKEGLQHLEIRAKILEWSRIYDIKLNFKAGINGIIYKAINKH
jgi:hypothetical protein